MYLACTSSRLVKKNEFIHLLVVELQYALSVDGSTLHSQYRNTKEMCLPE